MRSNLHPLRILPVGQDPSVLASNGLSKTGAAEVTLATRTNSCVNPHAVSTSGWSGVSSTGAAAGVVLDDGDGDAACVECTRTGSGSALAIVAASGLTAASGGWLECKGGDSIAAIGSIKPLPGVEFSRLRLMVRFRDSGDVALGGNVLVQELTTDILPGEWHRLAGVVTAPQDAAYSAIWLQGDHAEGTDAVMRVDRVLLTAQEGIDWSPDMFFDGSSPGASWSGTPNASTSKLVVPVYDPRLGDFRDGTQAVRVYWPAGGTAADGHWLTQELGSEDVYSALSHFWTADPGSVGLPVRLAVDFLPGTTGTSLGVLQYAAELDAAPQPLAISGAIPEGATHARLYVIRGSGSTLETNLLYSASQVSPHPIERYRDERVQGWRLRDEEDYAAGAESIPAPVHRNPTVSIKPYASALGIEANSTSLSFAGEETEAVPA